MVTRRITFRLYPSKAQETKLFEARRLHAWLYNQAVADRKLSYKHEGRSVNYFDQQNTLPSMKGVMPQFRMLGSQALQATIKRVDFAFQRFFKGLAAYPKFKATRLYSGWTYPNKQSWSAETSGVNGYLELRDLGLRVQMRGKAKQWGVPTTCTILYRHGKWFASITVNCEPARYDGGKGAIGIDLGVKTAISIVHQDGRKERIENPRFIQRSAEHRKRLSKRLRRKVAPNKKKRIKGSRRWKKARGHLSRLESRIARQRRDWQHQVTTQIIRCNGMVGAEKLNTKGMTRKAKKGSKRKRQKAGLNRNILDVGFGAITQMLKYKLWASEGVYHECNTRQVKPSQRCAKCWTVTKKSLSDRIHVCSNPKCGHTEDRDWNAAEVNLIQAIRGMERASLDVDGSALLESPRSVKDTGGFKQLAQRKRQKRRHKSSATAGLETPLADAAG